MLFSSDLGFEIHALWTCADNNDYDDLIWDIIFEEEGIISEEDFLEDEIVRNILDEFNSMTDLEYYNKYYGENK